MADEEVSIKFGADIAEIKDAVNQIKEQVGGLQENASDTSERFLELGKIIAEAFVVKEIAEFIEKLTDVGEQIERVVGMTGLGVETIQTLRFAMEKTGGSAEGAGIMITRLERNIDEAASGTGRAYEAFQKLGVSLHQLQTESIDDLLRRTIDGFRGVSDSIERAKLSTEVGSRGFAQMLPAIMQSTEGLKEFHDKLIELNDDLSPHTVKALAETHGKFEDLHKAVEGAAIQAFLDFKGAIDGVVEDLTAAIVVIGKLIGWFRELQTVLSVDLVIAAGRIIEAFKDFGAEGSAIAEDIKIRFKASWEVIAESAKLNFSAATDTIKKAEAEILANNKKFQDQILQNARDYDSLKKSALEAANAILAAENAKEGGGDRKYNRDGGGKSNSGVSAAEDQFKWMVQQNIKDIETQEAVNKKVTQQMVRDYQSMVAPVERAFDGMLNGILSGTQTWQQAMGRMFTNIAASFVENAIHKMIASWITAEATKTAATIAGNEARTLSDASAATSSAGFNIEKAAATIFGDAAKAYAGVFGFLAPEMGPFAAIPAAAAFALVAGMEALLPSFEVGTNYVPQTGLAMIHQGEMIIPARQAQNIRDGGANSGSNVNVNISLNAIDTRTGTQFLKDNMRTIAAGIAGQVRNANSHVTSMRAA